MFSLSKSMNEWHTTYQQHVLFLMDAFRCWVSLLRSCTIKQDFHGITNRRFPPTTHSLDAQKTPIHSRWAVIGLPC